MLPRRNATDKTNHADKRVAAYVLYYILSLARRGEMELSTYLLRCAILTDAQGGLLSYLCYVRINTVTGWEGGERGVWGRPLNWPTDK